jgi:hypothetical protein
MFGVYGVRSGGRTIKIEHANQPSKVQKDFKKMLTPQLLLVSILSGEIASTRLPCLLE